MARTTEGWLVPGDETTHLCLISDRSGSMSSIKDDAQGGINQLIADQAKVPGEITVSLYQFDTDYEKVFGPVPAAEADEYELIPRGMTALLDAVNRAIADTKEYINSLDSPPDRVVVVISTDGHENSSKEVSKAQVKEAIETATEDDWEFIYLGANVDAFSEGGSLGINTTTQYHATGASVRNTYAGVSSSLTAARLAGSTSAVADHLATEYDEEGRASGTRSND